MPYPPWAGPPAGYLEREKVHGERGRFSGTVYTLHTVSKTPWTENPPTVEMVKADPPLTDYPTTADPTTENPPLQNKDNINTPYSPPEGDADGGRGHREIGLVLPAVAIEPRGGVRDIGPAVPLPLLGAPVPLQGLGHPAEEFVDVLRLTLDAVLQYDPESPPTA